MSVLLLQGSSGGFKIEYFPEDLLSTAAPIWRKLANKAPRDPRYNSEFHSPKKAMDPATISGDVVVAAAMLADGDLLTNFRPSSGLVKMTDTCYVCEYHHSDDSVTFAMYDRGSGKFFAQKAVGETQKVDPSATIFESFPQLSTRDKKNLVPLILPVLAAMRDWAPSIADDINIIGNHMFSDPGNEECHQAMYRVSDAFYFLLEDNKFPLLLDTNGNIDKPDNQTLLSGNYDKDEILCGFPKLLMETNSGGTEASKKVKRGTIAEWKQNPDVQAYVLTQGEWTEEEREWIPTFPDDTQVTPETAELIMAHILGQKSKRPIVNMMWRGTTGHGKSTGVEMMAAVLNKPLLRMTCYSTMEAEKFLSVIMPDTSAKAPITPVTFQEISCDPEGAYEKLTGQFVEGINEEEVFAEAVKRMAATTSSTPKYVMRESAYIQALEHGYIVEIQECSRIRDAGVLPGLNEYDRPGAMIPMVDGTYRKRHPLAIAVFTDNVGLNSCNEYDPSFLRRIQYIIDSAVISKDEMVRRVMKNTGVADKRKVSAMYDVWSKIYQHCKDNDLLSAGGCVTIEEFERWVQLTDLVGDDKLEDMCKRCIVSKATTDYDEQKTIITAIMIPEISKLKKALASNK